MISKRTWVMGTALLVVLVIFLSELLTAHGSCGSGAVARSTRNAILRAEGGRAGNCGALAAPESRPLLIGLLFFGVVATAGSAASDMRAWRNSGMDD